MTILRNDGSNSSGTSPVPRKRSKLSLNNQNNNRSNNQTETVNMDHMAGIPALYPIPSQRQPPKYDEDVGRRNGVHDDSPASETSTNTNSSVQIMATVSNMGNTCYLNSVLYTLRFTPHFLHQLHHVISELSSIKPRAVDGVTRPARIQLAIERLHEVFLTMRGCEDSRDGPRDAVQPLHFLNIFREVNSVFETNQQHDAHELLVALLDNLRDICAELKNAREEKRNEVVNEPEQKVKSGGVLSRFKKKKNKNKDDLREASVTPPPPQIVNAVDPNFISKDFEGTSILQTTCLECETCKERRETFCDICVPIETATDVNGEPLTDNALYHELILKSEFISGANKYWCEECVHYTEAKRSIKYEIIPKILILQMKRFSSSSANHVSKINEFMPTPLTLDCFCDECKTENEKFVKNEFGEGGSNGMTNGGGNAFTKHKYNLFAAIMHLGATIASGHYVSYVKANGNSQDYINCDIHTANMQMAAASTSNNNSNGSTNGKILKFLKSNKNEKMVQSSLGNGYCNSVDCCGVKLLLEHSTIPDTAWLECDDDKIAVLSNREFQDKLSEKDAITPYLLFYSRA